MTPEKTVALAWALAGTLATAAVAPHPAAAVSFEMYTDRAAFDARLAGDVKVVDFDDIDTAAADPAAFPPEHYRSSKGAVIIGKGGQLVSRDFGLPDDFAPVSSPNLYAPGDNETDVSFYTGFQPTAVAGVGAVFIDADYPLIGPSSLTVRTAGGAAFSTGTVSGSNHSQLFRGIVAVDEGSGQPTPAIVAAHFVTGSGYIGDDSGEGTGLDDLVFGTPRGLVPGEVCDNCIDDDGDGYIDRADSDCDHPADGGGAGIGDPGTAKALGKCQKALAKGGSTFAQVTQKVLGGCIAGVFACHQTKPGDPACVAKAKARCDKNSAKVEGLATKVIHAINKSCAELSPTAVFDARGLGFDAERNDCELYGEPLNDGSSLSLCLGRQQTCRATQLVSRAYPRARELAATIDIDPPCLETGADGNQAGLADPALVKCQAAIAKASMTFTSKRMKAVAKCLDGAFTCLQQKPGNDACRRKVAGKYAKSAATVFGGVDAPKSLAGKAATTIAKACGAIPFSDLLDAGGLGMGAFASDCAAAGIPTLDSVADLSRCLVHFQTCRSDRLLEKQYPRAFELRAIAYGF